MSKEDILSWLRQVWSPESETSPTLIRAIPVTVSAAAFEHPRPGHLHSGAELRLLTPRPLDVGQEMELELHFDQNGLFPVRFQGVCQWGHVKNGGVIEVGIDLTSSNQRALAALESYQTAKGSNH